MDAMEDTGLHLWVGWLTLILHMNKVKKLTKHELSISTGLDITHACCSWVSSSLNSSSSPNISASPLAIL
ncbi:hypothetical protein E2C01_017378 [Portunus trituberculatus]|uniref:Uncharacterized protein n=1 Tax=Portunus trituberculatus TaxID=210409 RepID=A0A5B7DT93_PORTR|nr:hypothetical protein [Portunus trituberculatus]